MKKIIYKKNIYAESCKGARDCACDCICACACNETELRKIKKMVFKNYFLRK